MPTVTINPFDKDSVSFVFYNELIFLNKDREREFNKNGWTLVDPKRDVAVGDLQVKEVKGKD